MGAGNPSNFKKEQDEDSTYVYYYYIEEDIQRVNENYNRASCALGTSLEFDLNRSSMTNSMSMGLVSQQIGEQYNDNDKNRLQQLNQDPNRKFAPPKMLKRKLVYSPGKVLFKNDMVEVLLGLEHRTGTVVEINRYSFSHLNQAKIDYINNQIIFQTNLHHDRIRKILDVQFTDEHFIVVTEYQPNKNLQQFCQTYPGLQISIARQFLKEIVDALAYCHKTQVAHQEILSKNVSIGAKMALKLGKFGASSRALKGAKILSGPIYQQIKTNDVFQREAWQLGCLSVELLLSYPLYSQFKEFNVLLDCLLLGELQVNPNQAFQAILGKECCEYLQMCFEKKTAEQIKQCAFLSHSDLDPDVETLIPDDNGDQKYKYQQEYIANQFDVFMLEPQFDEEKIYVDGQIEFSTDHVSKSSHHTLTTGYLQEVQWLKVGEVQVPLVETSYYQFAQPPNEFRFAGFSEQ